MHRFSLALHLLVNSSLSSHVRFFTIKKTSYLFKSWAFCLDEEEIDTQAFHDEYSNIYKIKPPSKMLQTDGVYFSEITVSTGKELFVYACIILY